MHWTTLTLFISSIFFACILLFDLRHRGLSYFFHIRDLFSLLFLLFVFLAFSAIVFTVYESPETAIIRAKTANAVAAMMCLIYGFLAASLSHYKEVKSSREVISKFFWKEPCLPLVIYCCIITTWMLLTLFATPFQAVRLTNLLTGEVEYATIHGTWYRILLSIVLAAVLAYPCLIFFRLSKLVTDKKLKEALVAFAVCLVLFAISTPLLTLIRQYGYSELELTYLLHTVILAALWCAFKNPVGLPKFLEITHAFAGRLGLRHNELVGKKILFEFDAASNYEKAIRDFVHEGRANGEPVIIFTRKSSGLNSNLAERTGLKFFHLTSQVSVPKATTSENDILLPSNDTSLLLDTLNNTVKTHPNGNVNIVFDNLSDLILSVGFEKTYSFTQYTLEILTSRRTTAIFLLNSSAHDPKISSSIKNLFSNQLYHGKEGLQIIKLSPHKTQPSRNQHTQQQQLISA